jgi:hypothetical protein
MARSKQALWLPSSVDGHEALTVWIISAKTRVVYRRKRQNLRATRNPEKLLQNRNGASDCTTGATIPA